MSAPTFERGHERDADVSGFDASVQATLESLQRDAGNSAVSNLIARGSRKSVPAGDGQERPTGDGDALPPDIRAAGRRRVQTDLSDVRLHADAGAAELTKSMNAVAATIGRDVYLSPGAADIRSVEGQRTLLHELVHAAQAPAGHGRDLLTVSDPHGPAEREAHSLSAGGFAGTGPAPTQVAGPGVAHRKVGDEKEEAEDAVKPEKVPDFLNPEPLTDEEVKAGGGTVPTKAGDFGAGEAVAFEVRVVAPLRRAVAAVSQTEWETAYQRMQELGGALWEYEQAFETKNPALAAELRGIRGWLALAVNQIKGRFGGNSMSDGHIEQLLEEATADLESVGSRLG